MNLRSPPRGPILVCLIAAPLLLATFLLASPGPGGDINQQRPRWTLESVPPAPVLSPQDALKTFSLPPGFHIELVACEPLIEEPIALAFDPDGRIYVAELRGYMHDITGPGELDPVGRVTRLEDTDGDGRMDKATRFLENLIIPRAIAMAGDGLIVAEPPDISFARDTDGDGKADEKKLLLKGYGTRIVNPEHLPNGLMYGLDNWYYNAKSSERYRFTDGKLLREPTPARGQWGVTQDDLGRLFFNANNVMLQAELVPAQYMMRNPFFTTVPTSNVSIASNAVRPGRVTPGTNRAYTDDVGMDAKLQKVTAACAPMIYRGDKFPQEYYGNAFVCEPAGNLVSRQVLSQQGVRLTATGARNGDVDFLTSTDERFRPVNCYTAPDGTIYIVDLYRGVLQHKTYLSSYLEDQVKQRGLEQGIHLGRIYRIVHDSAKPGPAPKLSKATPEELVKTLSHPNGWWRDTAQRLIVQGNLQAAVPFLNQLIEAGGAGTTSLAKIHALWALEGLGKFDDETIAAACRDADPNVRVAALRVAENIMRKPESGATYQAMLAMGNEQDAAVRLQLLITLSSYGPARKIVGNILTTNRNDPFFRAAAISGASGRELELLQYLLADPTFAVNGPGKADILYELAQCLVRGRSADRIEALLEMIAVMPAPTPPPLGEAGRGAAPEVPVAPAAPTAGGRGGRRGGGRGAALTGTDQETLLTGVADAVTPQTRGGASRRLRLTRMPPALPKLIENPAPRIQQLATRLQDGMSWPGKPNDNTPPLVPLTAAEQARFDAGKLLFSQTCAACHQPSGLGQEGVGPPLVDSEWALGPVSRPARIILYGVRGQVPVGNRTWDLEMPGINTFTDEQIASVLTYVRREWGHEGDPVAPEAIAAVRRETASRSRDKQWTADELLAIP